MIATVLSNRRRAIGMSIDELAEKSGIPKSTVAKVLSGVAQNPTLETVKSITYALGLTLNDIDGQTVGGITDDEWKLLEDYRSLDPYSQRVVRAVISIEAARRENKDEEHSEERTPSTEE